MMDVRTPRRVAQFLGLSVRSRHAEARACLMLSLLAALVFSLWPQLDLAVSRAFYAGDGRFPWREALGVQGVYQLVPWLGRLALVAGLVLLWRHWRGHRRLSHRLLRRVLAGVLVLLLGVGLVVHAVFKEQWGRARPNAVAEFGGDRHFTPALLPATQCARNCSFVSGHAATGFALMGVALLAPVACRRRWLLAGGLAGAGIGLVRIVQGGHFLSDVVFAGLMVWAVCLGLREAWLMWRAWRWLRLPQPRLELGGP